MTKLSQKLRIAAFTILATALAGSVAQGQTADDALVAYYLGDFATALSGFRLAAENGDTYAQAQLGKMIGMGEGVAQDNIEALRWLRLAAGNGEAYGQAELAQYYYKGKGVPQDYVQAHVWWNLAAAQNYGEAALLRELLEFKMTPDQIAEAQRLAAEWKPTQP